MGRGVHRGFITHEELNKSLGKRNLSSENLEKAFLHMLNEKISLVEKKSDFKVLRKKDSSSKEEGRAIEKSDDPIRMYLREMGGVELLSREGEIAIAKRIEAGKDVMTNALIQSPITAKKIFEWQEKIKNNELLVREIIDIDATYLDIDSESGDGISNKNKLNKKKQTDKDLKEKTDKDSKEKKDEKEENNQDYFDDDEFNPSLAAMEEEIKPKVILTIDILAKNYSKLIKYQNEILNCSLNAKEITRSKGSGYQKIQNEITEKIKTLQLNQTVLEELVGDHYQENKKMASTARATLKSKLRESNANYLDNLTDSVVTFADGMDSMVEPTTALKGIANGAAGVSGLTAVTLSADTTLAVNTHSVQVGKYVNIATDAKTLTLPAVVVGASFIIVNSAADGEALLTISPDSGDKFLVDIAGAAGTDNKDIINTKATQIKYDYVKLVGLSSVGWLIDDIRGTWVDQA